jgi:hypothetical protein
LLSQFLGGSIGGEVTPNQNQKGKSKDDEWLSKTPTKVPSFPLMGSSQSKPTVSSSLASPSFVKSNITNDNNKKPSNKSQNSQSQSSTNSKPVGIPGVPGIDSRPPINKFSRSLEDEADEGMTNSPDSIEGGAEGEESNEREFRIGDLDKERIGKLRRFEFEVEEESEGEGEEMGDDEWWGQHVRGRGKLFPRKERKCFCEAE